MTITYNTPARMPALLTLSAGAALALGGLSITPAYAHDTLIASTPEEGEVLEESPDEVVLEFSGAGLTVGDAVTNDIWVLDTDGENWASEDPAEVDGNIMSTDIPEPLPDGEYEVLYRVVYSDGHDEELSFSFEVEAGEEDATEEDEQDEATEEETSEAATEEETDTAEEDTPAEEETESPQTEQTAEESETSAWIPLAIGAGVLGLLAVVGVLIRHKMKGTTED
ncbi:copper resistance CopC family protein [Nesterenkonia alba]|uniref:copper resistance CopC family protein n=1 Tax=Nesterenkonia alba TaxID=515814 RepID=UPI0003B326B2|nr:copper resistance CopC family protein [Nesterenkonia alba]